MTCTASVSALWCALKPPAIPLEGPTTEHSSMPKKIANPAPAAPFVPPLDLDLHALAALVSTLEERVFAGDTGDHAQGLALAATRLAQVVRDAHA
jgi:hypothetical protein